MVAETWDGWLSDIAAFAVTEEHALAALRGAAAAGPVAEGNVGGGTGMICHEFKGGIGTSSRVVVVGGTEFTVGVLVQANYGARADLRIDGDPSVAASESTSCRRRGAQPLQPLDHRDRRHRRPTPPRPVPAVGPTGDRRTEPGWGHRRQLQR